MSKDIIRWVIDCMLRHDDSITQELALTVERESRAEWGGVPNVPNKTCEGRPGRPSVAPEVLRAAHADALGTAPTAEIINRHGISRATFYRLMKKGPPGVG
jgi:hypothetical protein